MTDFKKPYNKFSKDSRPGGYARPSGGRPSFGGSRGPRSDSRGFGDREQPEMFTATCSKCHKACEVPFRPNGKKPIFCRDCFQREDGGRPSNDRNDRFEKRSYNDERPMGRPAPVAEDPRIGAMQRELTTMHAKLDLLMKTLEGAAYSSIIASSNERTEKPVKADAKAPASRALKKKA